MRTNRYLVSEMPRFVLDDDFDPDDELNAPGIRDSADVIIKRRGVIGTRVVEVTIIRLERRRMRIYDADKISDASINRICNLMYGRYCRMQTGYNTPDAGRFFDYFGFH